MFGILARTFHTATRIEPPHLPTTPPRATQLWRAPRHWFAPVDPSQEALRR
ncbi:MAG: hypothetical protein AAGF79_13275 [Pseudomonadota bacterium]